MVQDQQQEEHGLARRIGPGVLLLFVAGNLLGAGIYAIVGEVAGETGGALWAGFLAAAVLAVPTLFAYLELITKFPRAGGAGLYAAKAFGRPWLTITVTVGIAASALTSAATSARAFADGYLPAFVDLPATPVAVLFLALLSVVNFAGISESMRATAVMAVITVAGLLLVVGVGIWSLQGEGDLSRVTDLRGDGALSGLQAVLGGAALAFFAYVGFEDTAQVAEEVRRPRRTLPIAMLGGVALTTVVYLLVAVAASVVLPADELAGAEGPLLRVVESASAVPGEVVAGIALVALTKTALVQLVAGSRLLYGIADRGLLPRALSRVHPGRRTPWVAVVLAGLLAVVLTATGDLGGLADTTVMLLLTVFVLVDVSVLRLRREQVDHPYLRVPTWLPVTGALVSAGLVVQTALSSGPAVLLRYAALLGGGLTVYALQRLVAPHTGQLDAEDLRGR